MKKRKPAPRKGRRKNKGGRPSPYDSRIHPVIARAGARNGSTGAQIAAMLGIRESTLYEWAKKYPKFSESIKEGREFADGLVEDSLFRRATGYDFADTLPSGKKAKRHVVADVTAQIFWLKNRKPAKWRDKHEFKHEGPSMPFDARGAVEELMTNPEAFAKACELAEKVADKMPAAPEQPAPIDPTAPGA